MGISRFDVRGQGGRRSSSRIPPWGDGRALSAGAQQGGRLDQNDPGDQQSAQSLGRCPGNRISGHGCAVIYLMCHGTACLSTRCSSRVRAGLRIADVRPVNDTPVRPLSAYRPGILTRVLSCTYHRGSRARGAHVCATWYCSVVAHRIQDRRSWSVSTVEVVDAYQATELTQQELGLAVGYNKPGWLCSQPRLTSKGTVQVSINVRGLLVESGSLLRPPWSLSDVRCARCPTCPP